MPQVQCVPNVANAPLISVSGVGLSSSAHGNQVGLVSILPAKYPDHTAIEPEAHGTGLIQFATHGRPASTWQLREEEISEMHDAMENQV